MTDIDLEAMNNGPHIPEYRFRDDCLDIWTHDEHALNEFTDFLNSISARLGMKTKLSFTVNTVKENLISWIPLFIWKTVNFNLMFIQNRLTPTFIFYQIHAILKRTQRIYHTVSLSDRGEFSPKRKLLTTEAKNITSIL